MKYYYLHIHALNLHEDKKGSGSYYINSVLPDIIVQANGFWGSDQLSLDILENEKLKIKYKIIKNIKYGDNLIVGANPNIQKLPKFLYKLTFFGIPGKDDVGIYNHSHLVVSEYGLDCLRKGGVENAESDSIIGSIDEYFEKDKHYFWMPEPFRSKFIERFTAKKDRN